MKILIFASFATLAHSQITFPPRMPSVWPLTDQTYPIDGGPLLDPIVVESMAWIQKVVPASLLNIKPSTFVSGSTVIYNENATTVSLFNLVLLLA